MPHIMKATTACPGCGLELPAVEGQVEPYGNSSAACWSSFGEVMAREFSGAAYFASHRLSVDAYMVQHQIQTSRSSIRSLWLHLVGLYLMLDRAASSKYVASVQNRLTTPKREFPRLDPAAKNASITVERLKETSDPIAHKEAAKEWALAVWNSWSMHHRAIESVVASLELEAPNPSIERTRPGKPGRAPHVKR